MASILVFVEYKKRQNQLSQIEPEDCFSGIGSTITAPSLRVINALVKQVLRK